MGDRFVARRQADIRISLKKKGGTTWRIELVKTLGGRRFQVLRDRRRSAKLPEATATEIAAALRKWLVAEAHRPPIEWMNLLQDSGESPD